MYRACMKHRDQANPGTEVLRVGTDLEHRVGTCPHQQIVNFAFVLMRDVSDGLGFFKITVKRLTRSTSDVTLAWPNFRLNSIKSPSHVWMPRLMQEIFSTV